MDIFKGKSIIDFRANVNNFSIYQPSLFFEDNVKKYEDELISNYDIESGMFVQYQYLLNNIEILDERKFIEYGIDLFYDNNTNYNCRKFIYYDDNDKIQIKERDKFIKFLQKLSKSKLSEIVIDRLFQDNIYNMFLNIKEMLRFNKKLDDDKKILDSERVEFYEKILNIDKLDSNTIIELYQKLKDKDIALMFYQDLRDLKDKSYDMIKENLFSPEKMMNLIDKEKTTKYGVNVFDLRDNKYSILARCLCDTQNSRWWHKRDCYTLLTDENPNVINKVAYIYGYSGFDNDCVLHIFEGDSFSGDVINNDLNSGSNRVNRIMTDREIATNSYWYSEVQIVNKKSDKEEIFETLRPSFLIVYNEISKEILEEAKSKNIPICIISEKNFDKDLEGKISFYDKLDTYIGELGLDSYSEELRRKNR